MLKLMKYELRRNRTILLILYIAIAFLEGFALFSLINKSEVNTLRSFLFLYMGAILGIVLIFIMAIMSYSKELGSKYSYMSFMTPTSTFKIIGSKLLTTFLVAAVTTIIAVLLVILDYNILINQFTEVKNIQQEIIMLLTMRGIDMQNITISIFVVLLLLWVSIFTSICFAYFAITLSATVFANKSYRGVISFVIFVVITLIINKISGYLPSLDIGTGALNKLMTPGLTYLLNIFAMFVAFFGSGILLDKRVSL